MTPELSNYNTVTYAKTMFTLDADVVECETKYFENICKKFKTVNESIPDDKPVKMYFDADYKFDDNFEDYNVNCADEVLRLNKLYLTKFFLDMCGIEPRFASAESHYKSRMVDCYGLCHITPALPIYALHYSRSLMFTVLFAHACRHLLS